MAARAGVEPTTLQLKAIDSTKAPPCPTPPLWHSADLTLSTLHYPGGLCDTILDCVWLWFNVCLLFSLFIFLFFLFMPTFGTCARVVKNDSMNDCEINYSNERDYSDDSYNDYSLRQPWCCPLCLIEALPFHDLGQCCPTRGPPTDFMRPASVG